jgi:hypothetical protein
MPLPIAPKVHAWLSLDGEASNAKHLVAFAASISIPAYSKSKQPAPNHVDQATPAQETKNPNSEASNAEQKPVKAEQPSVAPELPLNNAQAADQRGGETRCCEQKEPEGFFTGIKWTDAAIAFFTLVLAIYTARLYYATDKLWKEARDQRRDNRQTGAIQAIQTRKSLSIADKSANALVAAERAHVIEVIQNGTVDHMPAILTVNDGSETHFVYHGIRFSYFLKNFGKTPATIIAFDIDAIILPRLPSDEDALVSYNNKQIKMEKYILGSGDTTNVKEFGISIGVKSGSERSEKIDDFCISGYVKFVDVFENTTTRNFMWVYYPILDEFRPVKWLDEKQEKPAQGRADHAPGS